MFSSLRKAFFAGLVIVLPVGVTIFLFNWFIVKIGGSFKDEVLAFVPQDVLTADELALFWNIIATLIVLAIVTVLGYLSRYVMAKYLISLGDKVLNNIPVVNTVYTSVKQIVDTFSSQNRAVFQEVVLIEFPRPGSRAIGFLTGSAKGEIQKRTEDDLINIFVPTTPNPTSGFLVMFPRKDVTFLDMTVGEGMKLIISGGAVVPDWIPAEATETSALPKTE
ncbi:MAG: DUF502 domain-containing protein [Verrucomicrobiota bacterium]